MFIHELSLLAVGNWLGNIFSAFHLDGRMASCQEKSEKSSNVLRRRKQDLEMAETSQVWTSKSVKFGLWHTSRHRCFHIRQSVFTNKNVHRYTGNPSADTTTPLQMSIGRNIPNALKWRLSLTFGVIYCLLQFQTWSKRKQRLIMTLFWPWYVTSEGAPPSRWESWWRYCWNQWRSFCPLNYTLWQTQRPLLQTGQHLAVVLIYLG